MNVQKILKFTRKYKGPFDERVATWLFNQYLKSKIYTGITWFEEEEIVLYFSSNEYIQRRVWMQGYYETEVGKVFNAYVPKNGIALDIGANIGINSIRLSNLVGSSGKVYSFEPIPFNQERFSKNISLNRITNCELIKCALGISNEVIKIEVPSSEENMGAISLLNRSETTHSLSVEIVNGDDWIAEAKLDKLDFLKIDVEGFEWNVIKGLHKSIQKYHPKIVMEWDKDYQQKSDNPMINWEDFILENGYKLYQINRFDLQQLKNLEEAKNGNILFL